ncbi:PulJ/GspJ family protein [Bisgaard Taxon 45]
MLLRGYTLLSLLVSLSLSSFLLLIVVTFYLDVQRQSKSLHFQMQLQTELERVIQLMAKDIRRAGFRAPPDNAQQVNFSLFESDAERSLQLFSINGRNTSDCVLFFYDLDMNGCLGGKFKDKTCIRNGRNNTHQLERELFGYRLNNGMIETRLTYKSAVNSRCKLTECQRYLQQAACYSGGWVDLLDSQEYVISDLSFRWLVEKHALEIYLKGHLNKQTHVQYETTLVVPLLNSEG